MITEKDLENQNTFFKYGSDVIEHKSTVCYWYEGSFDCGLRVSDENISMFLHDEVYGKTWSLRNVDSLEDLEYLFNAIYGKDKFMVERNDHFELLQSLIK